MKTKPEMLLLLIALAALSTSAYSIEYTDTISPKVVKSMIYSSDVLASDDNALPVQNKTYKLLDLNGKILAEYEGLYHIKELSRGYAIKNGKYALLDSLGNCLTPFIYDDINFERSKETKLMTVKQGNNWGAIDHNGKNIIPSTYSTVLFNIGYIISFQHKKSGEYFSSESLPIVLNHKGDSICAGYFLVDFSIVDNYGAFIKYKDTSGQRKDKYNYITYLGKELNLPDSITTIEAKNKSDFIPGVLRFILNNERNIIVDSLANILFSDIYLPCDFKRGHTVAEAWDNNRKCGLIGNNGKLIVPFEYEGHYSEWNREHSGFIFRKGDKYFFFDENGTLKIDGADHIEGLELLAQLMAQTPEGMQLYDVQGNFIRELKDWVLTTNRKGHSGYKDLKGNSIIPCEYDDLTIETDNLCMVRKGKDVFFTNFSNNMLGAVYQDICRLKSTDSLRYLAYTSDKSPALLNDKAQVLVPSGEYNSINPNSRNNILEVNSPEGLGLLNAITGKLVASCRYLEISEFEGWDNAYLFINMKGQKGLVKEGKDIIICDPSNCLFDRIIPLNKDLAIIKANDLYGVINTEGEIIVPIEYESLSPYFSRRLVAVSIP